MLKLFKIDGKYVRRNTGGARPSNAVRTVLKFALGTK